MKGHEAIVHFPIALIISTFIFGVIGLLYKRDLFKEIIFWNLIVGVITSAIALYTGFKEQEGITDFRTKEILEMHVRNAYFILLILVSLVIWLAFRKKTMGVLEYAAWISLYFVGCASVAYQGFIGHEMSMKRTEQRIEIQAAKPRVEKPDVNYELAF